MPGWLVLVILLAMVVGAVIIVVVTRTEEKRRIERQRRFQLRDTDERLPLATPKEPTPRPAPAEIAAYLASSPLAPAAPALQDTLSDLDPDPEPPPPPEERIVVARGRFVNTPDGEMLLTEPPFALRETVFSKRNGRYAQALLRRLPPWLMICPRVRLDSILTPTSPDGRDADDWREWRRRVRVRSIDILVCDRRTWSPVLAIMIDREAPSTPAATTIAGGRDRIVDEVLGAVGLPLVRGSGVFKEDWPVIRPYVEQAMLPAPPEAAEQPPEAGPAWDASAAVALLRMDDEEGWVLE